MRFISRRCDMFTVSTASGRRPRFEPCGNQCELALTLHRLSYIPTATSSSLTQQDRVGMQPQTQSTAEQSCEISSRQFTGRPAGPSTGT